jgi:phosphatidylethanolamine-binding protein (PEBP) family uncharacterized protein
VSLDSICYPGLSFTKSVDDDVRMSAVSVMSKAQYFAVAASLATFAAVPSSALAMSVKFSWTGYQQCSTSSPAFIISDVPAGTVHLAFKMVDKNLPSYPHGGGTIAYDGNRQIPAGAFLYQGPCPPPGQQHTYEWTVQALAANGKIIASSTTAEDFPPR